MKKIWTIIKSRLQKPKTDTEIERKRAICLGCEFNSNNLRKLSTYKLFLASLSELYKYIARKEKTTVELKKTLSDLYSKIMGKEDEDNLSSCNYCGCSIYYKTILEDICPHPKGDKWNPNKETK